MPNYSQKNWEHCQIRNTKIQIMQRSCLLYSETLKQYKHTLRTKKAQYTQKQLTIIEKSVNTNQFWENWNNLKKTDHEELAIQNGESHFQTLFNKVQTNTNCKQIQRIKQLEKLELTIKDNQNPLDFPITDKEKQNQKPPTQKSICPWWDIKWNDKTHKQ